MAFLLVTDKECLALRLFPLLILGRVSSVDDIDAAVFSQCVVGGDIIQAFLKAMVQACDFVPCAEIPVDFKSADGLDASR